MLRRSSLLLVLALLACRPSSSGVPDHPRASAEAPARGQAEIEQPGHLVLPWAATLYAAPREDAIALRLGVAEDPESQQPAVAVIGREGAYWKVETVDAVALRELAIPAIEGLDFYALHLYVPIGVGDPIQPIPPGPDMPDDPAAARAKALADASEFGMIGLLASASSNPPLQSGDSRPPDLATDFRVSPSTTVYWADGREAGTVRSEHAFVEPGEVRTSEVGPLRCFTVRVGPDEGGGGELCFAVASVHEVAVVPEHGMPFGDAFADDAFAGDAFGNVEGWLLDEDYGEDGLGQIGAGGGLVGLGEGGGGSGGGLVGLGEGGGGSGSGYGSPTKVTIGKAKVTGSMDTDIARRIVRAHADEVRDCWDAPVPGAIDLTLEVDADGKVTASNASTIDRAIESCVEQAATTWKFPASLAGSLVLTLGIETPP